MNENEDVAEVAQDFMPKKEVLPERSVDGDGFKPHKTLDEVEEETADLSDFQSTLKVLFPKFRDKIINHVASAAMVARISPDTFLPNVYLTVVEVVDTYSLSAKINLQEVINLVYCAFSIGLDGKGRIDVFELNGASKENEELEKLSRSLSF